MKLGKADSLGRGRFSAALHVSGPWGKKGEGGCGRCFGVGDGKISNYYCSHLGPQSLPSPVGNLDYLKTSTLQANCRKQCLHG